MSRLRAFPDRRFIGTRDDMVLYDCDDPGRFAELEERIAADDLVRRRLVSSFSPDTAAEAASRGFSPVGRRVRRRRTR
jgi:hypothetical protein